MRVSSKKKSGRTTPNTLSTAVVDEYAAPYEAKRNEPNLWAVLIAKVAENTAAVKANTAALQANKEAADRLHKAPDGTPKMTKFVFKKVKDGEARVSWLHPEHGKRTVTIHGRNPVLFVEILSKKPDFEATREDLDKEFYRRLKYTRPTGYTYKKMIRGTRPEHCQFWDDLVFNPSKSQRYALKNYC